MGLLSGLAGLFYLFLKTRGGGVLIMPLIQVVVVLVVVGFVLWLINRFIPMARSIKTILNAVVVIAVILWLLSVFWSSRFAFQYSLGEVTVLLRRICGITPRLYPDREGCARSCPDSVGLIILISSPPVSGNGGKRAFRALPGGAGIRQALRNGDNSRTCPPTPRPGRR